MGDGSQKLKGNNRTDTIVLERISVARVPLKDFKTRKVSGINTEVTWCLQCQAVAESDLDALAGRWSSQRPAYTRRR